MPTLIVSGRDDIPLDRIFRGEELGTLVLPSGRTVSHRKFWLAYHDNPAGSLTIDAGAACALRDKGKSLLPAGVRAVEGRFARGALVRIVDEAGATVGVGLSNYSAAEMRRIMGRKSGELAEVLGQAPFVEAIHRDNLLLDAAL